MTKNDLFAYIEGLRIVQGRLAGQPFTLLPWQRRFLRNAFGPEPIDSALTIARGQGKSSLVAAVVCAALDGPLAQRESEVVVAASSFQQSQIIFRMTLAFLGDKVDARSLWRIQDSANKSEITYRPTNSRVRCIGSDPRRMHGIQASIVVADEIAQWEHTKIDAAISALDTSLGKIPGSRFVALGTRAASADHPFEKMLNDPLSYTQKHAASKTDPLFRKRTILKANPSLPWMPDLALRIKSDIGKAKGDESRLQAFKSLRLNLGVSDTLSSSLLTAETWERIEGDAPRRGRCVWGIDLGTSAAQSAVAAFWPDTGRLDVVSAFPEKPDLEARGQSDSVGRLYSTAHQRGELILAGENAVNVPILLREALERFGAPSALAADRWREAELRDSLKLAGIPVAALELRGMGFKDGGEDVRVFQSACVSGNVTPSRSLIMVAAMGEARVAVDPAGNQKLAKGSEGGRRLKARDDAAAAGILAVSLGRRRNRHRRSRGAYLGIA